MPMNYYVYYSYELWGRGYIGKRECRCPIEEDVKYYGSFRDRSFQPSEKIILFVCSSREEAYEVETKLHDFFEVNKNPHFANKARQNTKSFSFSASGEENPNYGGNNVSDEGRKRISEKTSRRLSSWEGNPFKKRGEESMSHGRRWVTNSSRCQEKYLRPGEEVPEGWIAGRMKRPSRSDESRQKTSNALKGKGKSEEHKEKLREALSNYWKGVKTQGKS